MSLLDYLNANAGAGSVNPPAPSQGSAAPSQGSALLANLIQQTNASDASKADAYQGQPVATGGGPQQTTPDSGTDVQGITIQAPPKPMNYGNSQQQAALDSSLNQEASAQTQEDQQPGERQGTTSYGILPQSMQHGTLSKVLGLLGDAYLVHHGRAPAYLQAQQQQTEANAMAGYDQNPQAAIQRLTATAEPGSLDTADKLRQTLASQQLQKQIQEQNFQYKAAQIADQKNRIAQSMAGTWGAAASAAKTPNDYNNIYQQATARAQSLDPSFDASIFGLPHPEDWKPGQQYGATEGQSLRNQATTRGQDMTQQNAQTAAGARLGSARIMAGSHTPPAQNLSQSDAIVMGKAERGEALTPGEQQRVQVLNTKTGRRPVPTGGASKFTPNQLYTDRNGHRATYTPGRGPGGTDWTPHQ